MSFGRVCPARLARVTGARASGKVAIPTGRLTGIQFMDIGFIGLGNMGQPMARRLIEAGHKLVVYDT